MIANCLWSAVCVERYGGNVILRKKHAACAIFYLTFGAVPPFQQKSWQRGRGKRKQKTESTATRPSCKKENRLMRQKIGVMTL